MKLRIALLQLLPGATLADQVRIGVEACREAKKRGADLALFPEMWSCGYTIPEDPDDLRDLSVPRESDYIQGFGRLARELDMAVGITYLERFDPAPRNTLTLFDRHGNAVLTYAKIHTCDFGDEARLTPGDDFYTASLDTATGTVRVGAMICYDREFPESARILMLQGAELILTPNACPMEINRLCQLRARAFENMLAIATVNYPAGQPDCNGHSTVFDGVPWLPDEPDVRDMQLLDAGEAPGVYLAELDLSRLRAHRETEVHGNAYRRPDRYGLLTVDNVQPPFVREDNRWLRSRASGEAGGRIHPGGIQIAAAQPNEIPAITALAAEMWEHPAEELAAEFASLLTEPEAALFAAKQDDALIGFAQCQLRRDYVEGTSTSPVGYLEGIFVAPAHRHRGIAAALLRACEAWAREKGCTEFASDCELENMDSLRFHQSLGFTEANRIICFTKKLQEATESDA